MNPNPNQNPQTQQQSGQQKNPSYGQQTKPGYDPQNKQSSSRPHGAGDDEADSSCGTSKDPNAKNDPSKKMGTQNH